MMNAVMNMGSKLVLTEQIKTLVKLTNYLVQVKFMKYRTVKPQGGGIAYIPKKRADPRIKMNAQMVAGA